MYLLYSKKTWELLREQGFVEFSDDEINSGKQPFKVDSDGTEYFLDVRYPTITRG